jgi:hypothetical protein
MIDVINMNDIRLCDTCDVAEICKYKEEAKDTEREILDKVKNDKAFLKVTLTCEKWRGRISNIR